MTGQGLQEVWFWYSPGSAGVHGKDVMDPSIAIANLTSVPVLVFVLGVIAARVRSDLRLPDPVHQAISVYLLLGIGLKGGVALEGADLGTVALPLLGTAALGALIPVCVFLVLGWIGRLGEMDRGSVAAHYGSTSLVTFTAMLVFLDRASVTYEPTVTTLLAAMEIPGIVVGIALGSRHAQRHVAWSATFREILLGKTVLLLLGGLVVGFFSGSAGFGRVEPFFSGILPGILALFLLHLGWTAGSRLGETLRAGPGLVVFALLFPLVAGSAGVLAGTLAGLSPGGAAVLGILSASASYIAAPAAVAIALPEADPSLPVMAALGVTFPVNLIVGIPLLATLSGALPAA